MSVLFHGNSMHKLLSYCGLVDAGISASEKDLPVDILQVLTQSTFVKALNRILLVYCTICIIQSHLNELCLQLLYLADDSLLDPPSANQEARYFVNVVFLLTVLTYIFLQIRLLDEIRSFCGD